ncbi:hypothetical protein BXQ17_10685 [Polaribacter sp. BM10]|uniref:hypothetical protein n=1 Tax=Polaribacter sp. BM10 TaxID=1529069 RepID=UPI00098A3F48|nr:hypothetical protein [Polaribacter sp. BM10]AQS94502.1 hypothetical protein BXQ17_10685 [Polaribacter sp. BM10]
MSAFNYIKKITIIFLLLSSHVVNSQIGFTEDFNGNEYLMLDDFDDIQAGTGYNSSNGGESGFGDFSFIWGNGYNTAIDNLVNMEIAKSRRYYNWREKQFNLIKEEIEKKLNTTFDDFDEAKNTFFSQIETRNVNKNKSGVKAKYINLRNSGYEKNRNYIRQLKSLKIREAEIRSGNINNSQFPLIKVNGVPLKEITSLSSISQFRNNIENFFIENSKNTHNYKYIVDKLNYLGSGFDNEMLRLKDNYYNNFSDWDKLGLMQFLLNYERYKDLVNCYVCIVPPELAKFRNSDMATEPVIENYAKINRGGGYSIFDQSYADHVYNIWYAREGRQEAIYQRNKIYAQRRDYIDNLVNSVDVDDLILKNAQNELNELTIDIPWSASVGTIANSKYTHFHFDGSRGYYKLEDGSIIVASSTEQALTKTGDLRDRYNDFNPNDKYYYIKLSGSNEWAEMLFNPDDLVGDLENLFKLAGLELGKSIGRYVLPIEDIKIIIDGKDFDGQEVSRLKAAGFLILAIVPGSKALKIVGNVADATVFATKVGGKTIVVKGIKGLRAFKSSNFRHNLSKVTGALPPNSQAHHVLPQKFRSSFEKAKINIDNPIFGAWWEKTDHLNNAWKYNEEWSSFFSSNSNPSQETIFNFAEGLMKKYGVSINF